MIYRNTSNEKGLMIGLAAVIIHWVSSYELREERISVAGIVNNTVEVVFAHAHASRDFVMHASRGNQQIDKE